MSIVTVVLCFFAYLIAGVVVVALSERFDGGPRDSNAVLGVVVLCWPFVTIGYLCLGVLVGLGWLVRKLEP